jgi:hypothetical protein
MRFPKANLNLLTSLLLMGLYFAWWVYVIYFFYSKKYDNNYAAATAAMGIFLLTGIIFLAYITSFLLEAKQNLENRRFYLRATLLLFVPVTCIALFEIARALLA